LSNNAQKSIVTHDAKTLGPKDRKDHAGRTVSADFDALNWAKKRYVTDILQNPYSERLIELIMKNPDLRTKFFERIKQSLPFADLAHFDQVRRTIEGLLGVEGVPPETDFKKVEALRAWLYEKLRAVVGEPDSENPKYPAPGTKDYDQANAAALLLGMIDRRNQSGQDPRSNQIRHALGGNLAFTPEGNWPLARKEFEGLKRLDELASGTDAKADFARRKRDQYHAVLGFLHNGGKGKYGLHSASRIRMLQDGSEANWDVLTHLTKAIPHLGGSNYARERLEDMLQFYDEKKLQALAELFDPKYINFRRSTQIHEQARRELIDALAKSPNGQLDAANQKKLDELVALRITMDILPQLLTTALASNSPNFQDTVELEKARLINERKDAVRAEVEQDIRRNAARQVIIAKFAEHGLNPEALDETKLGNITKPGSELWKISHDPQFLRIVAPLLKGSGLAAAWDKAKITFEGIAAHGDQPAREGWVDIARKNRPEQKQSVDYLEAHFFAPARAMVKAERPDFDTLSADEQWALVAKKAEEAYVSRYLFEQLYHEIKLKRHLRDNIKPFADAQQDILDLFVQTRDQLRAEHGQKWQELPVATKRTKIAERARQLLGKLPDSADPERNRARVAHFNALLSYMNESATNGTAVIYPDPDQFLDRVHAAANINELGLHSPLDERRKRQLAETEEEQENQIRRFTLLSAAADRRVKDLQLEQMATNQTLNSLMGMLMGKVKGRIQSKHVSASARADVDFVRKFRAFFDSSESNLKDAYFSPELTADQWKKWDELIAMATGSQSAHFFDVAPELLALIKEESAHKRRLEAELKAAKAKQEEIKKSVEKVFGREYGSNPRLALIAARNKTLREENDRLKQLNDWARDLYARAASEYVGFHKLYEGDIPSDTSTGMGTPTPAWANEYALEALLDYRRTMHRGKELARSLQIPGHSTENVPRLDGNDPQTELERRAINEWIDSSLAEDRLFGFGKVDPAALEREMLAIRNAEGGKDLSPYLVYRTALTNLQRRGAAGAFADFWRDAHKESTAKRAKEDRVVSQLADVQIQMPDGSRRTLKLGWNGATWDASKLDVPALTYGLAHPDRVSYGSKPGPVDLQTLITEAGEISHEKVDLLKQIKNATRREFDSHYNTGHAAKFQFNDSTVATLSVDPETGVESFTYEDAKPYRDKIGSVLGKLRDCQRIWGAKLGHLRELTNIPAEAAIVGDFRRYAEVGRIMEGWVTGEDTDIHIKPLQECFQANLNAYYELRNYGTVKYWDEQKPGEDQTADGGYMLYLEPTPAEDIAMNILIATFAMEIQRMQTHHENIEDLDAQIREALVWAAVEIVTLGAGKLLTMGRAGLKLLLYASRTVQWAKNAYRIGKFAIRTAGMVTKMVRAARLAARFNRLGGVINYGYMRAKTRYLTSRAGGPGEWKDVVNAVWWTDDPAEEAKWNEYIRNHAQGPTALDPSIDTNGNMIPDYYESGSMPAVAQRYADTEKEFYKSMATFAAMAPVAAGLGYLIPARYAYLIDPLSFGLSAAGTEIGFQGSEHGFGNIDYADVAIRGGTSTLYGARFPGFFADLAANTAVDVMGAVINYHKSNADLEAFGLKGNEATGATFLGVPITTLTDAVGSNIGMNIYFARQAGLRHKIDKIKRQLEKNPPRSLAEFQKIQADMRAEVPEMFEALKQMEGKDVAELIRTLEAKAKSGPKAEKDAAQQFLDHLKDLGEKGLLPLKLDELKGDDFANSRRSVGEIAESIKNRELADFWHKWSTNRDSVSVEEVIRMAERHHPSNAENPMWRFAQEDNPVLALLGPKDIIAKFDPKNEAHQALLPLLAQHYLVGNKPPPPPNEALKTAVEQHEQATGFAARARGLLIPITRWRYNQQSKAAERYQQRLEGFSYFLSVRLKGGGQDDIKAIRKEYVTLENTHALAEALKSGKISLQDAVASFGVPHVDNAMALLNRNEQKNIYHRDAPDKAREIERVEEVGKKLDQYEKDTAVLSAPDNDPRFKNAADAQQQKAAARSRVDKLLKELMDIQGAADPEVVIRTAAQLPVKGMDLNDPVTQQFVKFMAGANSMPEAYLKHAIREGTYGDTMVHILANGFNINQFSKVTGFSFDTMMRAYPKALEASTKNMTLTEALHPNHLSSPEFGAAIRREAGLIEVKKVTDEGNAEQRAAKMDALVQQPYFAQGAGYDLIPVQHLDIGLKPSNKGQEAKKVPGPNGTTVVSGNPEHRRFIKNLARRANVNPDNFLWWLHNNRAKMKEGTTISDLLTEFKNKGKPGPRVTPTTN
ncbi:MAG: hypothetical protein KDD51_05285, partial [Bdellovibrionales bacterium]|nr:hypothetical protein [Bdellovibrionales bacterium]